MGMLSARAALEALRAGNRRFVSKLGLESGATREAEPLRAPHRELPVGQQEPLAIVLGCSDARVPAEIVFDQGLGDLFVIRVAGNIVAPSGIGSVEFAASAFGTRLVVVLGHSNCGAVHATLEQLARPSREQSRNLRSIVDRIRPAVEPLLERTPAVDARTLEQQAVRANIRMSVEQLRRGSEVLEQLIAEEGLRVVGAEYSLETGVVEFLQGEAL
jgi:carbonic anhydrase